MPRLEVVRRQLVAALSGLFLLINHGVASAGSMQEAALSYIEALPTTTKVYVWPTTLRVYEIVGIGPLQSVTEVIAEYDRIYPEIALWPFPAPPFISIYVYGNQTSDPWAEFASLSSLPASYKRSLSSVVLDSDGCVFTGLFSRDTWASGGVIFLNESRLPNKEEQRECVEAGLDYINGFPTTPRFDYRDFPSREVRSLVLKAVLSCSREGPLVGEPLERTKDGLTPLPTMECIAQRLGSQKNGDKKAH